jgi:hypothetical protein
LREVTGAEACKVEESESIERSFRSLDVLASAVIALPEAHIFDDGEAWFYPVRMTEIMEDTVIGVPSRSVPLFTGGRNTPGPSPVGRSVRVRESWRTARYPDNPGCGR